VWTGFIKPRRGIDGWCCEHNTEPCGSLKGRKFLDKLPKISFTPWRSLVIKFACLLQNSEIYARIKLIKLSSCNHSYCIEMKLRLKKIHWKIT
jgi:hypothetical protein